MPAADLADTKPAVDPEAGAEILLREVTITQTLADTEYQYFVRAKIYSERGLEDFTKIDLPYDKETDITNIAVRTIKPDGSIVELTKKDIYDREIIKVGKEREKVKSFSPAGLQPGAIVEYRFIETTDRFKWYIQMFFQSSLPTRVARFKFQPLDLSTIDSAQAAHLNARAISFNCPPQKMKPEKDGFFRFEMTNVAAAKDEPNQPPRLNCQASIIICYSLDEQKDAKSYWSKQSRDLHTRMLKETKDSKIVKTTLDSIISPTDAEEQKLHKIYDFCRTKLVNRYTDVANFTRDQRAKFRSNETASDTLKAGHGSGEDINMAFVALARAAKLDARYVNAGDRSFMLFDSSLMEPFLASDLIAGVKIGGQWLYFDPGVAYLPYATPYWRNSFTGAVIADPKGMEIAAINPSQSEVSQLKRKATLKLETDGTLEGDVTLEYSGHQAVVQKFALDAKTDSERETYIREDVQETLKLAEVTDVKVENATDPLTPLKISFHLKIPEYADRTGSRLFFQPAVFQKNAPSRYTEEKRHTNIMFRYCYQDHDDIRIAPPEGYELEEASAPESLNMGGLGSYDIVIGKSKKTGDVVYRRNFSLNAINIPVAHYPAVRAAFEVMNKRDEHVLTLRRKGEPAGTTPAAPAPAASTPPAEATQTAQPSA